jgi:hypothetical protein
VYDIIIYVIKRGADGLTLRIEEVKTMDEIEKQILMEILRMLSEIAAAIKDLKKG